MRIPSRKQLSSVAYRIKVKHYIWSTKTTFHAFQMFNSSKKYLTKQKDFHTKKKKYDRREEGKLIVGDAAPNSWIQCLSTDPRVKSSSNINNEILSTIVTEENKEEQKNSTKNSNKNIYSSNLNRKQILDFQKGDRPLVLNFGSYS